jgi:archaetidylinositol phosphate synthase
MGTKISCAGGAEVLNNIRDRANSLIEPIAKVFAKTGITPNALTVVGLVIGISAAVLFARGSQLLAGFTLLVAGFFDIIDGAVARVSGKETAFGGVLDSVMDRYVDLLIFAGIIFAFISGAIAEPNFMLGWGWLWGVMAIVGSFMVSYIRARAEAAGSGKLAVGVAERAERLLILAICGLLNLTAYATVLIVILTHITVIQRIYISWRRLR